MTRKNLAKKYIEMMEAAQAYVIEAKPKSESPCDVAKIMAPILQQKMQENFYTLHLNTRNHVVNINHVTTGLVDRTSVHAREVFRQAIIDNASRIILCHNHPSGDPTPSPQDISCTKELIAAGKILGIEVLDHIVIGQKTTTRQNYYLSFREEGLL